jgi:hypothetical protein
MADLDAPMNAVAFGHVLAARMPESIAERKTKAGACQAEPSEGTSAEKMGKSYNSYIFETAKALNYINKILSPAIRARMISAQNTVKTGLNFMIS